ncbi:MAG: response regulator [Chitinophagaceae bacterium]
MSLYNFANKVPHIVLANDNPDECITFLDALENQGIEHIFSLAENGAMLLSMLDEKEFLPDIIFIDLNMKGISGKDCLVAIRGCIQLDYIPVIVYASAVDDLDIEYCFNQKANMYIVKSSFANKLSDLLETVLQLPLNKLLSVEKDQFLKEMIMS